MHETNFPAKATWAPCLISVSQAVEEPRADARATYDPSVRRRSVGEPPRQNQIVSHASERLPGLRRAGDPLHSLHLAMPHAGSRCLLHPASRKARAHLRLCMAGVARRLLPCSILCSFVDEKPLAQQAKQFKTSNATPRQDSQKAAIVFEVCACLDVAVNRRERITALSAEGVARDLGPRRRLPSLVFRAANQAGDAFDSFSFKTHGDDVGN